MDWKHHAAALADQVCDPRSQWGGPVSEVPRHQLLPNWWEPAAMGTWGLHHGEADEDAWMATAYADRTVVTEVAGLHADHAEDGQQPAKYGQPTSSGTLPSLVVQMFRHARVYDGCDLLDVGTGSGYSAALAAKLLGNRHVASVDVNPYLTAAATARLADMGLTPDIMAIDATGDLPGDYDRIVSMTSVRPVPASWLKVLRPGGRLVTTLANTGLILTADKSRDGGASGRIEWDRARFMTARGGDDTGAGLRNVHLVVDSMVEDVEPTTSPYPVVNVHEAWDLLALMEIDAPGTQHDYREFNAGGRMAWMLGADGSWAKAIGDDRHDPARVFQGGPRRLWDMLDAHRARWLSEGSLPVYGAQAVIQPDGVIRLSRGDWKATID